MTDIFRKRRFQHRAMRKGGDRCRRASYARPVAVHDEPVTVVIRVRPRAAHRFGEGSSGAWCRWHRRYRYSTRWVRQRSTVRQPPDIRLPYLSKTQARIWFKGTPGNSGPTANKRLRRESAKPKTRQVGFPHCCSDQIWKKAA